jgi:hypothetical protein
MNERIKELAEQATEEVMKTTPSFLVTNEMWKEKFAELIVGHATECVRDVLRDENSELSYAAATQVQNRIKEFFGVEE